MRSVILTAAVVCGVAVASGSARTLDHTAHDGRTLTVQVADYFGMPAGALVQAQHHVALVFGAIGISTHWRETREPAPIDAGSFVTIVLLSRDMAERKAREVRTPHVLAVSALPPAARAWVFSERVLNEAAKRNCAAGLLLGHTIAHETAHAIAGVGHMREGTMRDAVRFTPEGLDGLFGAEEADQIRAALNTDAVLLARRGVAGRQRP
jgi:hypothetical protein